jgi:nicotinamidase/pyrazinamidase
MRALILVDLQDDFLPGGPLAVPAGDEVIPIANRLQPQFDLVVATQDWHPPDHGSFAASHPGRKPGEVVELNGLEQILWPVHCIRNTPGARFAAGLDLGRLNGVFPKGTNPGIDSYSGFYDNGHRKATGLGDFLKQMGVTNAYVLGLATDYCVKFTALDAAGLGFRTFVIEDACRGVELQPGDVARAFKEMKKHDVTIIQSNDVTSLASAPDSA